ncbi:MAG: 30S ribosomal protein S27ae [Candidatus Methanospirare jalkutatii]|nr:30S ribosomal protein S27ae [Methanophagales archaeon]MCU4140486.1 Ribosomal protein S27AE [Methanophagales archaeon]MCW3132460.1 30S ribosomal protein S27ae [Candidatus Methanospirare jalkutatii]MCW7075564.1 30S ribosomal protein S27ae [Candidatus Methanospirare jalkutatii]
MAKKQVKGRVHTFYEVFEEGGELKLRRKRRACPRCGAGVFLAEHSDRYSCGKCGYTEFKPQRK